MNAPSGLGEFLFDDLKISDGNSPEGPEETNSLVRFSLSYPSLTKPTQVFMSATRRLTLDDRITAGEAGEAPLLASIGSDTSEFGAGVKVYGDVASKGSVFLRSNSSVFGDVRTEGSLLRQNDVTIHGEAEEGSVIDSAQLEWDVKWPENAENDVSLPPDTPNTPILPGVFDALQIFDADAMGTTALAQPFTIIGRQDRDGASADESEGVLLAFPSETCGLLAIQGAFRDRGDFARIVKREVSSGTKSMEVKYLKTQTVHKQDSRIVGGHAACFPGVQAVFEGHFIVAEDRFPDGADVSDDFGGFASSGDILDPSGAPLYPQDTACFLTGVEGRLQGEAEEMGVRTTQSDDGRWRWYINGNTKDRNNYLRIEVACIDRPRSETLIGDGSSSESVWVDARGDGPADDMPSHSCALASVTGRMFNQHDFVLIKERDFFDPTPERDFPCAAPFAGFGNECTSWDLHVEGDDHLFFSFNQRVKATCFEY